MTPRDTLSTPVTVFVYPCNSFTILQVNLTTFFNCTHSVCWVLYQLTLTMTLCRCSQYAKSFRVFTAFIAAIRYVLTTDKSACNRINIDANTTAFVAFLSLSLITFVHSCCLIDNCPQQVVTLNFDLKVIYGRKINRAGIKI